jgi:UDP-3-O-[3-hydroxymyristoyl] glucosamine N-acyltransferase
MRSIPDGQRHLGSPSTPEREQMLKQAAWAKLPELRKQFKALQKQVRELEDQLSRSGRDAA